MNGTSLASDMKQGVYIHAIRAWTPPYKLDQKSALEFMKRRLEAPEESALFMDRIYTRSAIDFRYSVLPDYARLEGRPGDFLPPTPGLEPFPTTAQRNDVYAAAAEHLGAISAADLLDVPVTLPLEGPSNAFPGDGSQAIPGPCAGHVSPDLRADAVTHLVTFSCTGFTAPGFEMRIQKALKLSDRVQRFHLGFMGCYASFPALRLANSLCLSDPRAKVLVVGVELCTLHMQKVMNSDNILANALFADGAYAMLVSSDPRDSRRSQPIYVLDGFMTQLVPGSEERMAWDIGDHGFEMKLSSYVPQLIEENLPDLAADLRKLHGLELRDIPHFAIHPGGRAILDRVKTKLGLPEDALISSYRTLKNFGNMSAVTYGFLLADLASCGAIPGRVFGAAFGPGLTVEVSLMRLFPELATTEAKIGMQAATGDVARTRECAEGPGLIPGGELQDAGAVVQGVAP